jgi:hypothetical protein
VVWLAPRALEDSVHPRRLVGASVRPLNFTVRHRLDMPDLRPLALFSALALGVTSASALVLSGYSVVKLHPGLNNLDHAFGGHPVSVVIGHRENFDAHSFDVVTFYLWDRDAAKGLDIVGLWDKDKEALSLNVSGGLTASFMTFASFGRTKDARHCW